MPLLYYGLHVAWRTPPLAPTQLIAHRGGPKYAPENTLAAFEHAIAQGVGWLEFDVQMTQDGVLVIIHDETVDRTTDGTGSVRDLTFAQIRALDAGRGEKVPTFQEVVELAKAHGVKLLPETKSAHLYAGLEEKILHVLDEAGYLDRTVIQSFEAASLDTLHRLNPQARLCALYGLWPFSVSAPPGDAQFVCPMAEMVLLNPGIIRQAHGEGRQVFVWFGLLENPLLFRVMRFFGADGLMSDDPVALREALSPP
ncbi:MAG: glycerophosphodiester phosphodiesterase [Anaerolineae bacterium]|nr:glycerophosphodiester phosphodiesterase [Anaerolineae bacterium]